MRFATAALLLVLAAVPAAAADRPPPPELLEELFAVMQPQRNFELLREEYRKVFTRTMEASLAGVALNPAQRRTFEQMQNDVFAVIETSLDWKSFEPDAVALYQRTFTEREIQGILEFYRTDAGRSLLEKMPQVLAAMVQVGAEKGQAMQPRIKEIVESSVKRMQACQDASKCPAGT
jgi:hypothetical protein